MTRPVKTLLLQVLLFLLLSHALVGPLQAAPSKVAWRTLQPGIEYTTLPIKASSDSREGLMHAVRINPKLARIIPVLASQRDGKRRTAAEWCVQADLAVAINAGMFSTDGISNVGYLRAGDHENSSTWNQYRSVLCLYPHKKNRAIVRWLDLDPATKVPPQAREYSVVLQNLRLIKAPGKNVWANGNRRWSEAAVSLDGEGRLLFLFTRTPFTMPEFNRAVLRMPLGIRQAMHVEGGPEASLSIHCGGIDLDLCGSFETGFREDDSNLPQWAIPNVLGVVRAR